MLKNFKNKQGGFLRLIILIVALIFLMKYFGVSFSEIIRWLEIFLNYVKDFFASLA
ncbi:MAG TPA: hypothetical protein VJC14_02590 [Candidatus Paceibacterota bacterium]